MTSVGRSTVLRAGQIVAGKYRVLGELGRGGMGVVFKALHIQLDHLVAIKVMRGPLADAPGHQERFWREARAARRLRSEHIIQVLDVGELADGQPYMVLEYLDGRSLRAELEARGNVPPVEACQLVFEVCKGMAVSHSQGVIHRDLKPSNIFLAEVPGRKRVIKILDFGISKASLGQDLQATETRSDAFLGTPHYMAPEQMRNPRLVDARADIWSMGAMLYRMLSGKRPFAGETLPVVCASVLYDPPEAVKWPDLGVSPELGAIIERCLAKDADQRFATVAELAAELAGHAGHEAITVDQLRALTKVEARVVGGFEVSSATGESETATDSRPLGSSRAEPTAIARRVSRKWWMPAAALGGAISALVLWSPSSTSSPATAPTQPNPGRLADPTVVPSDAPARKGQATGLASSAASAPASVSVPNAVSTARPEPPARRSRSRRPRPRRASPEAVPPIATEVSPDAGIDPADRRL